MCFGSKGSTKAPPSPNPPTFMPMPSDTTNRDQRMRAIDSDTSGQTATPGDKLGTPTQPTATPARGMR